MDAPIASPAHAQQASTGSTAQTSPTVMGAPQPCLKSQSTDAYLKDFTLLAEAAKRAQMAVLMRDFESVGL